MTGQDWIAMGLIVVALVTVFVFDRAERRERRRIPPISQKTLARYRDQDQP